MKELVRVVLKIYIKFSYLFFSQSKIKKYDIVFFEHFPKSSVSLRSELQSSLKTKVITNNLSLMQKIKIISQSKVVYTDNTNIIFASLPTMSQYVILYWHASSAIKKFGLPTIKNNFVRKLRKNDYVAYDLIPVSSRKMKEAFIEAFACDPEKIVEIGSVYGQHVYALTKQGRNASQDYILYVPTFRPSQSANNQVKEFIINWSNSDYKLVYSIHPSIEFNYNTNNVVQISSGEVYKYCQSASLIISDYSSLLVDASLLNDKVVMYDFDREAYERNVGLSIDDFWGEQISTLQDLSVYLKKSSFKSHDCQMIKDLYFEFEDSQTIAAINLLGENYVNSKENC